VETIWFAIVSVMLAVYVVLDGFDFGAGILHRFVARTDAERRTVLAAIGPVWDGNEVWLLAAGGVLFCAFPRAYAASFSGFYLPLMIVLWLLILRGIAIEFRSHMDNPLWHEFWDTILVFASSLMAIVLGTSLGNVVRGIPVAKDGYFAMPLFTDFQLGRYPGVFDWYTSLVGLFALVLLAGHGGLYLTWKTSGPVQERSRRLARFTWLVALPFWLITTACTFWIQPQLFQNLVARPWSLILVLGVLGSVVAVFRFLKQGRERAAFLSSCVFILAILAATMTGLYPVLLQSTLDPSQSITAFNAATGEYGLRTAMVWWIVGISLVVFYFLHLFWSFRGKVGESQQT
jgi:cytochrome d ubiquinol oxidase subunit II